MDNNVVVAEEVEVTWRIPEDCIEDHLTVHLTANSHAAGTPLQFPIDKDSYLHFDGQEAHFTEFWKPGSGHPPGPVFLDMHSTENDVHFHFDVTSDNTDDWGKDWAEIIAK